MKKEDMQRMLAQVDEQYISEIIESAADADMLYADEISGEVPVIKHISHWRNWAAAVAAFAVCIGLGTVLIRPAIQHSQLEVGESVACYVDFVESLSDEELNNYFKGIPKEFDEFPPDMQGISHIENVTPPICKELSDKIDVIFLSETGQTPATKAKLIYKGNTVSIQVYDAQNLPKAFDEFEPYHIDDYDVDFYGSYIDYAQTDINTDMKYFSSNYFTYHGRLYYLMTEDLTQRETIDILYQILDADFSAESLYQQYCGDFVSIEDSRSLTLEEANQFEFCKGLVPEIQNIGSLKFESIEKSPHISTLQTDDGKEYSNTDYYDYAVHYSEPNVQGHELTIYYAPDDERNIVYASKVTFGTINEMSIDDDDNSKRHFSFHAGTFGMYIDAVGCTQEEIDLCLNKMNTLLEKNYHASDTILEYLNQKVIVQNWIPEISNWNDFDFQYASIYPTSDERSPIPEIQVYYQNKSKNAGFSCQYMKFPEDDSQAMLDIADMSDTWIVQNYSNQEIQNPDLWINCHDYYVHITAENCTSQAIDGYLFDLAQHYRETA